jgi:lysyl-tRNA synthetase class 2
MRREAVVSSVITSLGYERETNTMEVEFKTGRVYRYFMIPEGVFQELLRSESIGRHFNKEIRDRYPSREVLAE